VGHRSSVRHTAWLLLAALVAGVLPCSFVPASPTARRAGSPVEHKESAKEQAEAEPLKLLVLAQRKAHTGPTRGWLTLREARRHKLRLRFLSLSYEFEDPRRVLIPLRLDPPPDGLA
jgi:hypothetical protein